MKDVAYFHIEHTAGSAGAEQKPSHGSPWGAAADLHFTEGPPAGLPRAVKKLGLTPCFDSAVLFPPLAANPEVACYGMIPSPTRHVPAPIHPRLFAGGDSHRSQGFLYPWKPYAPPHIPVYCRFVPPPAAAEQTGKPVGTPAMLLPPAAAKTSWECVGECGAGIGPG